MAWLVAIDMSIDDSRLGYNPKSAESIFEYALRLRGRTLREATGLGELADPHIRRGAFGSAVEEFYFRIKPNSSPRMDFDGAGLELKTTPLKFGPKGKLLAKERLVITMISYEDVVNEDFEHSHFMEKARNILLISYLYDSSKNPLDYEIKSVARWSIPEEDLPQIKHDWETVVSKVRAGHAEDISGGDTLYLEACTKARDSSVRTAQPFSEVPAKPRAWAFKASYMTEVQRKMVDSSERIPRSENEKEFDLLTLLAERFSPYFGMTEQELACRFAISGSKDRCARIIKRILGLDDKSKVEEFEKADIVPKTVRLRKSGRPKEAMSFPAFDYFELSEKAFESSSFLECLLRKYLLVVYREDEKDTYRLKDICLWQMPEKDLPEARRCYEQMQDNVRHGRGDVSVRSTENRCCHVRPHARNSSDVRPQPFGPPVVKKCFWLNQGYLQNEISRVLGS